MDKRVTGSVLLICGIVLLLVGANMRAWWTASERGASIGLGLHSFVACEGSSCESTSYDTLGAQTDRAWMITGTIAFYGAFIASGLGALAAILALAGTLVAGPVSPARLTMAFALSMLIAAIIFISLRPHDLEASPGIAMFAYIIGTVLMCGGAQLAAAKRTPSSLLPQHAFANEGVLPVRTVPACPTCRAPTEWVSEHARFFCSRCSAYLDSRG